MRRPFATILLAAIGAAGLGLAGCETAPKTQPERQVLIDKSGQTITEFRSLDPSMQSWFDSSHGYAVFPAVGSGAFIVGGSFGRGVVYERGVAIGFADIKQGSVGLQAGGQGYSEIIFFQTKEIFDSFKSGTFSFSADATAVAASAGAAGQTTFKNGVAAFIKGQSGLMAGAAIGGQGFSFEAF